MEKSYLHAEFRALQEAAGNFRQLLERWDAFRGKALANMDRPPGLVRDVVSQLRRVQGDRPPEAIMILDHGCGSGFVLLYLLALGYTGIFGVDIQPKGSHPALNELCNDILDLQGPRFVTYDGKAIPFEDGFFDFVFSTQVVDHIEPAYWERYFSEEARVLRAGGGIFHEVPHRLAPYDSHTRTWFLHYLPRPLHRRIYGLTGRGAPDVHCLRLPSTIRRALRRHFSKTIDYTAEAFLENSEPESFEASRQLRRTIHAACTAPLVGPMFRAVLVPMLMMRVGATKTEAHRNGSPR